MEQGNYFESHGWLRSEIFSVQEYERTSHSEPGENHRNEHEENEGMWIYGIVDLSFINNITVFYYFFMFIFVKPM